MRDVNRIDPLLARLGEVWQRYPDLRLGQLLHVAAGGDPYNVECDALVSRLEAWDAKRRGVEIVRLKRKLCEKGDTVLYDGWHWLVVSAGGDWCRIQMTSPLRAMCSVRRTDCVIVPEGA